MSLPFAVLTLFFAVLTTVLGSSAASAAGSAPPLEEAFTHLRTGHPRLLVLDTDVQRVKNLSETDPTAKKMRQQLTEAGEKLLATPTTVEYKLVGPRLLDQSRQCLARVYTLATLYRLDGDRKWAERAKKELFAAAAFPDWNPSHFLDVAEMTHAFAIGYDWLYPALTPEERTTIRTAIVDKGLKRGREAYEGTKPWKWWTTVHHNWNQVCNGGLTLGALAVADEEPELAKFIVTSALKSLPLAMASFGPDGGWNEGPGYWSYTVRYTVPLIAGLESALGTDFGLATANGFDRTGTFRLYFVGPTGRAFNYADAGEGADQAPDMWWLAERFQQPLYAWEANRASGKNASALDLLWYKPVTMNPKTAKAPLDTIFRGVDVAFLRSAWEDPEALWVGFKGGDNAANHSHLDLGTFVFEALGERWVSALGADNYNLPDYFGKARWTYFRLATIGQNTVQLDSVNQELKAKAPLIAFASKPDTAYAVTDLTGGYSTHASQVRRGVALVAERKALLVQDEVTASTPVEYAWQIHTRAQISVNGSEATLTLNSKTVAARILSPAGATFAEESDTPPALNGGQGPQQNPNKGFRRLMVRLPGKVTEARVAVLLVPQKSPGVPVPSVPVRPLEEWIKESPALPKLGGTL